MSLIVGGLVVEGREARGAEGVAGCCCRLASFSEVLQKVHFVNKFIYNL